MLKKIKPFIKTIGIFLVVLFLMFVVQAIWALISRAVTEQGAVAEQLLIERIYPLSVAVILIFWARNRWNKIYNNIIKSINLSRNNTCIFIKISLFSLCILYLTFFISGLLNQYEFIQFGLKEYSSVTILKQILLVGLIGNILVAIGEEIIFRGFLINYIIDITDNKIFALLFTSVVFSLHPYVDLLNYIIVFLAGLIMGYAYLKFKTLYIPIGIHFAYNLFNFSIASETSRGPQLPYLVKFDYAMIFDGFGAWVDLFIILGFSLVFIFLWLKRTSHEKRILGKII